MRHRHPVRTTTTVQYYLTENVMKKILIESMNLNPEDCEVEMDETSYGGIRGCTIRHTTITENNDDDF